MGRTLKRVPLDFDWPLKKVWGGYVNPYFSQSTKCAHCENGYSAHATMLQSQWYGDATFDPVAYGATPLSIDHPAIRLMAERNVKMDPDYYMTPVEYRSERAQMNMLYNQQFDGIVEVSFRKPAIEREVRRLYEFMSRQWSHHLIQADVDALIAADRLWDFTRRPRDNEQHLVVAMKIFSGGNSWLPESNRYAPTAEEVNARSIGGFSHDSSNQWLCVKARCERDGQPYVCDKCGGDSTVWPSEEIERQHDEWTEQEPPTGDGFQLWETTSEGSPISPVFATLEKLCEYAATNCYTFGSFRATAEKWREMLDGGLVCHREGNSIFL